MLSLPLSTCCVGLRSALVMLAVAVAVLPATDAIARIDGMPARGLRLVVSPRAVAITVEHMASGDASAGAMTVANRGELPFRYSFRAIADGSDLAAALELTAWRAADELDGTCLATPPSHVLYGPAPLAGGERRILGGSLAPGAGDLVCFTIALPATAANDLQGSSASLRLIVDAVQIEGGG